MHEGKLYGSLGVGLFGLIFIFVEDALPFGLVLLGIALWLFISSLPKETEEQRQERLKKEVQQVKQEYSGPNTKQAEQKLTDTLNNADYASVIKDNLSEEEIEKYIHTLAISMLFADKYGAKQLLVKHNEAYSCDIANYALNNMEQDMIEALTTFYMTDIYEALCTYFISKFPQYKSTDLNELIQFDKLKNFVVSMIAETPYTESLSFANYKNYIMSLFRNNESEMLMFLGINNENSKEETDTQNITHSKQEFLSKCKTIITEHEKDLPLRATTCADVLLPQIKEMLDKTNDFVSLELEKQAHFIVLNRCYANLSSGMYHIHYGELNPLGVAPALQTVHRKCAEWLYENGYLKTTEYEEHMQQLKENIANVG